jgi:uncharacterized membrane protein
MTRMKTFIRTSILGGILVILPVAISFIVFRWLFNMVTDLIAPLSEVVTKQAFLEGLLADIIVIVFLILLCFFVGVMVKTRFGRFIHENLEKRILNIAPGYSWIKETVIQFLGRTDKPFSEVVLVKPYENDTMMTGFITDRHANGLLTVFVPTGPNPTAGFIFHLESKWVQKVNTPSETAMRSVISCGAGTQAFMPNKEDSNGGS